jgi:hypothetical protein
MNMEDSLARYKALIRYANCSLEETIEIEAESRSRAAEKCLEIKDQNRALLERCREMGIFVSKEIKECVLCWMEMKDELQVCNEILDGIKLKEDV